MKIVNFHEEPNLGFTYYNKDVLKQVQKNIILETYRFTGNLIWTWLTPAINNENSIL